MKKAQHSTKQASPWGTQDQMAHVDHGIKPKHNVNKFEESVASYNRDNRPQAGPGSFTSVKYSGNPPGGKSQISFF